MKKKLVAIFVALVMTRALAACGAGEETTLTGMVVSVDGTVISLMEMDADMDFAGGERPELPEGMEGFGGFDPGEFDGTLPEGETFPQWGDGERPEMPEGMETPEGMERPTGEAGNRGGRGDRGNGQQGGMGNAELSEEFVISEGANYFTNIKEKE